MHLCIDIGNTQIALGLYDEPAAEGGEIGPEPVHGWRMRTEPRMTADELELAVRGMLGDLAPAVTGIAALSTEPSLARELRVMLDRRASRIPTLIVGPGVRTGVPLLVDHPREVGADRVVNSLAAHHLFGTTCVCVDFGTSTNIDVVSARGEFLGGALAPGIEISMEALATRAAALRTVELVTPRTVIGKNTVECLQAGVIYGFAGQVDGLVRRIVAELGPDRRAGHGAGHRRPGAADGRVLGHHRALRAGPDVVRAPPDLSAQRPPPGPGRGLTGNERPRRRSLAFRA